MNTNDNSRAVALESKVHGAQDQTLKHTPGPWTFTPGSGRTVCSKDGRPLICDVEYYPYINATDEDLLLMAAAPELLKAAKDFVSWADDCWGSWAINSEDTPKAKKEYNEAKAAIAKAENAVQG
jgi:hypothetical protein